MSSLLESGGGKKKPKTKLESCQGGSEGGEKGGTWKTRILLLVQTNQNEQKHAEEVYNRKFLTWCSIVWQLDS